MTTGVSPRPRPRTAAGGDAGADADAGANASSGAGVPPWQRRGRGRPGRSGRSARSGRQDRGARRGGPSWRVRLRRDRSLIIMTLPAVILLLIFGYTPMLGLVMAFQQYNVYNGLLYSPWVGMANFQQLFGDPAFWHALWNTLLLFSVQLLLFFPVPIALALLLDGLLSTRVKALVQSVTALPHFFSWVLVVTIFQKMIGGAGLLPQLLRQHGVANPIDLMTNASTFKFLVSAQLIWKEAGWNTIVFLAALAAISPSLYEAAAVDGAAWRHRTRHITLPGLKGITILLLILNLGYALTFGFEQLLIQRGAVGPGSAEVLTTFSYVFGIVNGNYSYGAAAGLFLGVTSLVLILAANKVAHVFGEDGLYRR